MAIAKWNKVRLFLDSNKCLYKSQENSKKIFSKSVVKK